MKFFLLYFFQTTAMKESTRDVDRYIKKLLIIAFKLRVTAASNGHADLKNILTRILQKLLTLKRQVKIVHSFMDHAKKSCEELLANLMRIMGVLNRRQVHM